MLVGRPGRPQYLQIWMTRKAGFVIRIILERSMIHIKLTRVGLIFLQNPVRLLLFLREVRTSSRLSQQSLERTRGTHHHETIL
jgi:hypothetical protein